MIRLGRPSRRGFTLIEFLLGLAITAMVGLAVSGMLTAVTMGAGSRRDGREVMVRAHVVQSRLGAYITPCRSLLQVNGSNLVLWLNDSRESGTVHATEIRWLVYSPADDAIDVCFVDFDDGWSQVQEDLNDLEYPPTANWSTVYNYYSGQGWLSSIRLVDAVESVSIAIDGATAQASRHVTFQIGFSAEAGAVVQTLSATIGLHHPPA